LDIQDQHQLVQLTPQGLVTYQSHNSESTLDLTFATPGLSNRVVECDVRLEVHHDSDHLPITITLDLNPPTPPPPERRVWDRVDVNLLLKSLNKNIPQAWAYSKGSLQHVVPVLLDAIASAIDTAVPVARISLRSQAHFTPECKEACIEAKQLRRIWQRERSEEAWQDYTEARNRKKHLIAYSLRKTNRERIEAVASQAAGVFKLNKWARSRESLAPTITPALSQPDGPMEQEPAAETGMFRDIFFPTPPEADLTDLDGYQYPEPLPCPRITGREIKKAIMKAAANKAPGPTTCYPCWRRSSTPVSATGYAPTASRNR